MMFRLVRAVLLVGGLASGAAWGDVLVLVPNDGGSFVMLDQLVDGNSARVGDKDFTDFVYDITVDLDGGDANAPAAAGVTVYGVQVGGDYGLLFDGKWAVSDGASLDVLIAFQVTPSAGRWIVGNTLWIDKVDADEGLVAVVENVYGTDPANPPADLIASKQVHHGESGGSVDANMTHSVAFGAAAEAWVRKDILLSSFGAGSSASLGEVGQSFAQIPEAASLAILALGAIAVFLRKRRGPLILLLMGLALAAVAAPAGAALLDVPDGNSYTLTEINAAGGLVIGDKLFSDFTLTSSATGLASAPSLSGVKAAGFSDQGDLGLRFVGNWSAAFGGDANSVLRYQVTVVNNPGWSINDVGLWMSAGSANGGGEVTMDEIVQDAALATLAETSPGETVYYRSPSDHNRYYAESFASADPIWVQQDISVRSNGPGSVAAVSEFTQTFGQSFEIPEPAAAGLLGVGALVLARRRRRFV